MLDGLTILIVEDEALVALDLCDAVTEMGGRPLGPFATVAEATALVSNTPFAGAILDANLLDRDVTPLALYLLKQGIPFVLHTGTGAPDQLRALYPDLPIVMKPGSAKSVLEALAGLIADGS